MTIKHEFGSWQLDVDRRVLMHDGWPPYEIDLDGMKNGANILDWIFQLEEKSWVTDAEIGDFVRAIRYLFDRSFCGSGRNDPIDVKEALRRLGVP